MEEKDNEIFAYFIIKIGTKGAMKKHDITIKDELKKRLYRDILIAEVSHQLMHLLKQKDEEEDFVAEFDL